MTSIGYLNGRWIDVGEMALAIDDVGFFQGVTAVERLRTWDRRLPLIEAHLLRFQHTTAVLRIDKLPPPDALRGLVEELLSRNSGSIDTGVILFATPGSRSGQSAPGGPQPTLGLHQSPLDFAQLDSLCREGQPLVVTGVRQPSPDCWPRDIKVRSRIHYYLADRIARETDPAALGVLLDDDGSVTETSMANIVIVHDGRLIVPPADRVLPGVILATVCELAARQGMTVERQPISIDALRSADEVLLTGTEAGVWPARQIDNLIKPPGPVCRALQESLRRFLSASGSSPSDTPQ